MQIRLIRTDTGEVIWQGSSLSGPLLQSVPLNPASPGTYTYKLQISLDAGVSGDTAMIFNRQMVALRTKR